MSMRTPEAILESVPGWEGATARELQGGLTNRSWLIEHQGKRAVLKVDDKTRGAPHGSRIDEAAIQVQAAAGGLAAVVLYADETALLTEYVVGEVWEPACLERDDNIERVAAALRRLHALPLSGRSFDATIAAQRYAARIDSQEMPFVARCRQVIESMRQPHNLCCCHNDLVAANIIATPDVMFLDWEYACDNDPMFDLATVIEHHQLSDRLALRMLDAYFGGDGERWRNKLAEQQLLYRALYWLWLAARPDADAAELERAAAGIAL